MPGNIDRYNTFVRDHQGYAGVRDDSGYEYDVAKLRVAPCAFREVDGYREKFRQTDGYHVRVFDVPWSARRQFRQWVLGYGYSEYIPLSQLDSADYSLGTDPDTGYSLATAAAREWHSRVLSTGPFPNVIWRLRRVTPLQDPQDPWLFASDCELMQGLGAFVEDPENDLLELNAAGQRVIVTELQPSGQSRPYVVPAIHYVDNDEAGWAQTAQVFEDDDGNESVIETPPAYRYGDGIARYKVTFTPRPYEVRSDTALRDVGGGELNRWVERREEYSIEALPLARIGATTLKFVEESPDFMVPLASLINTPVPEAGIQQLPMAALTYVWHEVPDRPLAAYASVVGRVNDADFDGLGGAPVYPAETLLCMPWVTKRERSVTGRVCWTITYRFLFRPQKWNRYPTAQGFFLKALLGGVVNGVEGDPVYKPGDFSRLFQVPPPTRYV